MAQYPLTGSSWDSKEYSAIQRVIDKGWFSMGEEVRAFENEWAQYIGSKYCVMVNSGSSANLAAVASLFYRKDNPLKPGDEVIVPAVSWSTTYFPLQQYGLHVKFVDIDIETLNYDLDALAAAVTEKTRMIVAVDLLGNSNDYDTINEIIAGRDIVLLEDSCESMAASYGGKKVGTFGLIGTFSCFFSHHISTMEGGLIVTDDYELYQIMLCLRAHGWTRNLPKENLVCGTKSDDPFEESFRFVLPGYNLRPMELSGAIGREQLKKLDKLIEKRRENASFFKELFSDSKYCRIQKEFGASSWFGFAIILSDDCKLSRKEVVTKLTQNDIECRPIVAGDFTKNEAIKYFDYELFGQMKNATIVDNRGFFVGNHHFDIKEQLMKLKGIMDEICG